MKHVCSFSETRTAELTRYFSTVARELGFCYTEFVAAIRMAERGIDYTAARAPDTAGQIAEIRRMGDGWSDERDSARAVVDIGRGRATTGGDA